MIHTHLRGGAKFAGRRAVEAGEFSLDFNGSEKYVEVPNHASYSGFSDFTIALRIKLMAWPSGSDVDYLCGVHDKTGDQRSWGMQLRGPDTSFPDEIQFIMSEDGTVGTLRLIGDDFVFQRSNIDDGAWHTVVLRRIGTTFTGWVDGVEVASSTRTFQGFTLHESAAPMQLASVANTARSADVRIADLYLWSRALSSQEIADHHSNQNVSGTDQVLKMLINEGSGSTTREEIQDVDGTITNATWSADHP